MDEDERERIKAEFQARPDRVAGAHPARHRRRERGHRPAAALPPDGPLRDPVEPEPARAAQRPHRPPRPAAPGGARSTTSSPRAARTTSRRRRGDLEFLSRVARKVEQIRDDLGVGRAGARRPGRRGDARPPHATRRRSDRPGPRRSPAPRCSRSSATCARRLARCHEQLQASIDEFGLTPERIERVVATGARAWPASRRCSRPTVRRRVPAPAARRVVAAHLARA